MGKKILLIGSSNIDLVANTYKIPEPGETVFDDGGLAYIPGGRGTNAALALKALSAEPRLLTKLGADSHGKTLFEYYKDSSLDTSLVKVDRQNTTGFTLVLKDGHGATRKICYRGANLNLSRDNVIDAFSARPDALMLGFDASFETTLLASEIAAEKKIPIFLNGDGAESDFNLEALPEIEIFSVNEKDALRLTGIKPLGADNALRVCLALCRRVRAKLVVLRLSERGAFVYDGRYHFVTPAFPVSEAVDTTLADDAFFAALSLIYLETGDVRASTRFACSLYAMTLSCGSFVTREENMSNLNKYPTI